MQHEASNCSWFPKGINLSSILTEFGIWNVKQKNNTLISVTSALKLEDIIPNI